MLVQGVFAIEGSIAVIAFEHRCMRWRIEMLLQGMLAIEGSIAVIAFENKGMSQ